jgi:hypothetical protein
MTWLVVQITGGYGNVCSTGYGCSEPEGRTRSGGETSRAFVGSQAATHVKSGHTAVAVVAVKMTASSLLPVPIIGDAHA